jgi:small subunit ribosomal protein S1
VILNIDSSAHRLSLGIKQLQPDAWETYLPDASGGRSGAWKDLPDGELRRAFVELAEGVEGLCHYSEVPGFSGRRGADELPISIGDELDFKIIKMSEPEKKIGLSLKPSRTTKRRPAYRTTSGRQPAATTTIEEVMSLKDRNLE